MFDERQQQQYLLLFRRRIRLASIAVAAVLALILLRFYYLQVIRGSFYRELSENNRLALVKTRAPRGIIYDRNRKVLAANRPSFRVSLVLEDVLDLEKTETMLVSALGLEPSVLRGSISRVGRFRKFEPLVVKEDVSRDRLSYLETLKYQYPGVNIEVEPRRYYPALSLAAHLLGYVGEVSQQELERRRVGYDLGDFVGKSGLEREYDQILKGIDGGFQVEVDSLGRRFRILNSQEPLPGYNLCLAIDQDIQSAAERALGDVPGAVVALDPNNGDLLALVSHPSYDPNLFSVGISADNWQSLAGDERNPMQNRALQSQYPPGSVFKLVVSIAALESGVIDPQTTFFCSGGLQFGNRFFRCWKKGGHGAVSLHRAIVESCDTYFYQVGLKTGIDTIARYARELGLGQRTGIELNGEWAGLVPDSAWKRKARGETWFPGETLSASIGQGYNLVTPLQMAVMIAAVANDGAVFRPRLVKEILAPDGRVLEEFKTKKLRQSAISPAVLSTVRRGMWGVVNEPMGTGGLARIKDVEVSGKTGTAQVIKMRQESEGGPQRNLPEKYRDHAWFASFAPSGAPQLVVVAMLEHGGHGGSAGAPVAQKVLRAFFDLQKGISPTSPEAGQSVEPPPPPAGMDEEGD